MKLIRVQFKTDPREETLRKHALVYKPILKKCELINNILNTLGLKLTAVTVKKHNG